MNYRFKTLQFAFDFYLEIGPDRLFLIDEVEFWRPGDPRYPAAFEQLLKEQLIRGIDSGDRGRAAVMVNPDKIQEIREKLDVWYRDVRFLLSSLLALAGWIVAVLALFL